MKLGCCASLWEDMILKLPAAGADYAEAGFSSLMGKSLDQVRARAAQLEKAGVSLESMNVLFPGDFRLTGPQADFSAVDSYLEENLPKAQALGVKVVVFGSGGARRVPEGFPQEEAFAQLVELCREHIAPAAAAHGITCCVEPLNQKETNILTTSGECFRLVEAVNHPNLQLLVDLYHFDLEGESLSALEARLPGVLFFRCQRSFLINLTHVRQLDSQGLLMSDGTLIPMNRGSRKPISEAYRQLRLRMEGDPAASPPFGEGCDGL